MVGFFFKLGLRDTAKKRIDPNKKTNCVKIEGSSFKNYLYIPKFLKNEIFHQISQTHISLNELDYMHFHDLCDA